MFEGKPVLAYPEGTGWQVFWSFQSAKEIHRFAAAKKLSKSAKIADLKPLFETLGLQHLPANLRSRIEPKVVSHLKRFVSNSMDLEQRCLGGGHWVAYWPAYTKKWASPSWNGDWSAPWDDESEEEEVIGTKIKVYCSLYLFFANLLMPA